MLPESIRESFETIGDVIGFPLTGKYISWVHKYFSSLLLPCKTFSKVAPPNPWGTLFTFNVYRHRDAVCKTKHKCHCNCTLIVYVGYDYTLSSKSNIATKAGLKSEIYIDVSSIFSFLGNLARMYVCNAKGYKKPLFHCEYEAFLELGSKKRNQL